MKIFLQKDSTDCGPACLAMVCSHFGKDVPISYISGLSSLDKSGSSFLNLASAAEELGFDAIPVSISFADDNNPSLDNAPLPCIVHWNSNHFVLVTKIIGNKVEIADPKVGKAKISKERFIHSWKEKNEKGFAMIIEPSELFNKEPIKSVEKESFVRSSIKHLKPHKLGIIKICLGLLLIALLATILPQLTQAVVDKAIPNRDIQLLLYLALGQLVIYISQSLYYVFQSKLMLNIGTQINIKNIGDYLRLILSFPISFFDSKTTGDILQRINDNVRIEGFLSSTLISMLYSLLTFIIFTGVLFYYSIWFGLCYIIISSIYFLWVGFFMKRRKILDYLEFDKLRSTKNEILEIVNGVKEIKLENSVTKRTDEWNNTQIKLFDIRKRVLTLELWQEHGANLIKQVGNICVLYMAAYAVMMNDMSLGTLLAVQFVLGQLGEPLTNFVFYVKEFQDALISHDRIIDTDNYSPEVHTNKSYLNLKHFDTFELQNVSFHYSQSQPPILSDLNLKVEKNDTLAIVGLSGSGKSTILNLILGFYKISDGLCLINGVSIDDYDINSWRSRCGVVLQDSYVFGDSIMNNICESDTDIDFERLNLALIISNSMEFVENLPSKLDTVLGATGVGLSKGQIQRILIARAVYKDPEILILDEATNSLDSENEDIIAKNLEEYYKEKTVIIVAHRLSTIKNADKIMVLNDGKVVETGTYNSLILEKGFFYNLLSKQSNVVV